MEDSRELAVTTLKSYNVTSSLKDPASSIRPSWPAMMEDSKNPRPGTRNSEPGTRTAHRASDSNVKERLVRHSFRDGGPFRLRPVAMADFHPVRRSLGGGGPRPCPP